MAWADAFPLVLPSHAVNGEAGALGECVVAGRNSGLGWDAFRSDGSEKRRVTIGS